MHDIARRAIETTEPIADLVRDFYGAGGPLAEAGWEIRPAQAEMSQRFAEQIDAAWSDEDTGSVGLIEAPTGTGKGQAYLVPGFLAALRAEARYRRTGQAVTTKTHPRKLVVSTANIALQSQLIQKDIPALGRMLGVEPRATLMKSRQNYVCREKLTEQEYALFKGVRGGSGLDDVIAWSRQPGCTGDREAYPGDASEVWSRVSVGSDECLRDACKHYSAEGGARPSCFWRAATVEWPSAHIIVGNHHWVAVSKGIRSIAYAVDEAHELESALRSVLGRQITTGTFLSTARRAAKALNRDPKPIEERVSQIAGRLFEQVERKLLRDVDAAEPTDPRWRAPTPLLPGWVGPFVQQGETDFKWLVSFRDAVLEAALALRGNTLREDGVQTDARKLTTEEAKAARQAAGAANKLAELCRMYSAVMVGRPNPEWPSSDSPWAIWAHRELDGDVWRPVVELVPADVAPAFSGLHDRYSTMILASATLPEFSSMRLELGLGAQADAPPRTPWPSAFKTDTGRYGDHARKVTLPGEDDDAPTDEPVSSVFATGTTLAPAPRYERRLPSPYDLARMGVLVVPSGPEPNDPTWPSWATRRVVEAVTEASGGALVLATSTAAMRRYASALRGSGRWRVICQGEQGRARTISAFKEDVDSVLVATRSFFQGLDVQGESCRLVVIDRIPFDSPDDPLEGAVGKLLVERAERMDPRSSGLNPWMLRSVPRAAMVLVQGVGRLIRSQSDRGAVVLLDTRITKPGPGWAKLRNALPPFPQSLDLRDIGRVLRGEVVASPIYQPARRVERPELTF